jgi:hypothetical protein
MIEDHLFYMYESMLITSIIILLAFGAWCLWHIIGCWVLGIIGLFLVVFGLIEWIAWGDH